MTAALFLGFCAAVTAVIAAVTAHYLSSQVAFRVLTSLLLWLLYVGLLAYFGVMQDPALRPPGMVLILLPVGLFVTFVAISSAGVRFALAVPLWVILGLQTFRIGVELLLHQLWRDGVVPRMLTYDGANVDILVGLSAPLVAWMATRGRVRERVALAWNLAGLIALANVAIRFILTTSGPLHLMQAEVPNRAAGTFPFTYIPGFLAPLALVLHVLAIRALRSRLSRTNG